MLLRKLFRTAWRYKAQFISMILMVAIGVGVFLGFNIEWKSIEVDTDSFFSDTKYADFRLYQEEGFSEADVAEINAISGVDAATRFLSVNAEVKDSDASVALMVSENYTVSTMQIMEGAAYDEDAEGIWLSDQFAEKNDIAIGDTMTLSYAGTEITAEVLGLCKSGEMMICTAGGTQLMPDFETFGYAYITPKMLESALGTAFYPQINILSDLSKEEMEEAVADALGRTIMVTPKEDHTSYAGALSEAEEGKSMGSVLPAFFLAIGILTMVTTMHRIAANEKTQIGTLKALGFRDRRILRHYTSYGFVIGLIGTALGILLGYGIAAMIMDKDGMMGTYFDLPDWSLVMPGFCIPLLLLTVALLTLISFLSVKKMLRGTAADALRPYVPKKMKRAAIEKLPFWEKRSFSTKWNMRDVLRHKSRSAMTLLGVIGCMILLVAGFGMKDCMAAFLDLFDEIGNYTTKATLVETVDNDEAAALADSLDGDWVSTSGISYEGRTVTMEIYHNDNDKIRIADENNEILSMEDDGVYLCLRLKDTAEIGDTIEISPYGSDDTYKVRVAGYFRSTLTESIAMTDDYAKEAGISYYITEIYTDEKAADVQDPLVAEKEDKQAIMDTYDSFMEIMNTMVLLLGVAAVALGVVVLYNLGVMSYVERSRELATLKVLGFRNRKLARLLISQNVWLTVLGVVIGLPAGIGTLQLLITVLASEYELALFLGALTYSVSILLTFGMSLAVGFFVARKNRKINMVEALKNAE